VELLWDIDWEHTPSDAQTLQLVGSIRNLTAIIFHWISDGWSRAVWRMLFASPLLHRLRSVDISDYSLLADAEVILEILQLPRLIKLHVQLQKTAALCNLLALLPSARGLAELQLGLSSSILCCADASPCSPLGLLSRCSLRKLTLGYAKLHQEHLTPVLAQPDSPLSQSLEQLTLGSYCELSDPLTDEPLPPAALEPFDCSSLVRLHTLTLQSVEEHLDGLLCSFSSAPALRWLRMETTEVLHPSLIALQHLLGANLQVAATLKCFRPPSCMGDAAVYQWWQSLQVCSPRLRVS